MGDRKVGQKDLQEFADVITDDLAVDAAEGLQLTRDPEKQKSRSEPGINLEELGLVPKKK